MIKYLNYFFITIVLATPALSKASANSWQSLIAQGDNDITLQKFVEAENCYRKALVKVKQASHNSEDVAKCTTKLASTLVLEDKNEEAIPLYWHALSILESAYGKNSPKVVPPLLALGSIFESQGDHGRAMSLYNRVLAINEKNFGPQSPAVAKSLRNLGHLNYGAGNIEQAKHDYKSSLAILMQQPGLTASTDLEGLLADYNDLLRQTENSNQNLISDFQTEILKDNIASLGQTAKVPASAWQKQMALSSSQGMGTQNDLEQQVLLRGFKRPMTSSTLKPAYNAMSEVLHTQHTNKEGEDYYQRMIAIDMKSLGANHPSVADDLTGLALFYISQQRYKEAEPLFKRALSIYEAAYGPDNMLVARTRTYLASVYDHLGNAQQAIALYDNNPGKYCMELEPNNLETARLLNELGFLYYSQGKLEDAAVIYQWALASTKAASGGDSALTASCLKDYANVLNSLGRTEEAIQMNGQANAITAKLQE